MADLLSVASLVDDDPTISTNITAATNIGRERMLIAYMPCPSMKHITDLDKCIETLRSGQMLPPHACKFICEKMIEILRQESNVKHVAAPVTVVGDVHGQLYDVLEMFRVGGQCPHTNYLFLGDYVDRGYYGVETISLLTCLKVRYPNRVVMIRGNHESRQTSLAYGFYAECLKKYGDANVWTYFTDMFDYLPLSAVIDDQIFATHGGLSPSLQTLDQIRVLDRFNEVPYSGPICDLMWGDPDDSIVGFKVSSRGAGYTFGRDVAEQFMHTNQVNYIVRAHQICHNGYQVLWDSFATVWSAPNYCYRLGNLASVLEIAENCKSKFFNVYSEAPASARRQPGQVAMGDAAGSSSDNLDGTGSAFKRSMRTDDGRVSSQRTDNPLTAAVAAAAAASSASLSSPVVASPLYNVPSLDDWREATPYSDLVGYDLADDLSKMI